MSLQHAANHLAAHGRGPDTELVHMTKGEVHGLQQLAQAHGGSLTVNPHTGLPEAGFLSNMLPAIAGAAAMYFSGGTAAPLLGGLGMGMSSAGVIGTGLGALQWARTGSLNKGLMAGLGAYGGAGLAGGLMGAGAAEIGKTAATDAVGEATKQGLTGEAYNQSIQNSVADKMAGASDFEKLSTGFNNPSTAVNAMGGGSGLLKTGLAAAAPALMAPQNEAPPVQTGDNVMPQRLQYNPGTATTPFPQPDVPSYESGMTQNFGRQQNYFPNAGYQNITAEQAKQMRGYADGGPVDGYPANVDINSMTGEQNEFAEGGLNLAGKYSRDLPDELDTTYAKAERVDNKPIMRGVKDETALRNRLRNPTMHAASGGLSSAASHLGDYSDGGRLLKGPGDGVSDSIPAVIGQKRPARLADGEFVVPARIVSELGNGSTEAGARKLYAMLDRVQKARGKTVGKDKVARNSRADKYLPA